MLVDKRVRNPVARPAARDPRPPDRRPNDVPAMSVVSGVLTELGGSTSHAAVVSREIGVACVVGCGQGTLMPLDGTLVTIDAAADEILEQPCAKRRGAGDRGEDGHAAIIRTTLARAGARGSASAT